MNRPMHEPDDVSPAEQADLGAFLQHMVKVGASDLFLSVGALPTAKVEGRMVAIGTEPLRPGAVRTMAYSVMTESQIRDFEASLECDLAVSVGGLGRFRFNVFPQRGEVSVVARLVKHEVPTLASLRLPAAKVMARFCSGVLIHTLMPEHPPVTMSGQPSPLRSSTAMS